MVFKDKIKNDWNLTNEELSSIDKEIKQENWLESIKFELWNLSDWIRWELKTTNESLVFKQKDLIYTLKDLLFEKIPNNEFVQILKSKSSNKKLTEPMQLIMICQTLMNIIWMKWSKWETLKIDAFYGQNSFYALVNYQSESDYYKEIAWSKINWLFDENTLNCIMKDLNDFLKVKEPPKDAGWENVVEVKDITWQEIPELPKNKQDSKSSDNLWDTWISQEISKTTKKEQEKMIDPKLKAEQNKQISEIDESIYQWFWVRITNNPASDKGLWDKKISLLKERWRLAESKYQEWLYNYMAWNIDNALICIDEAIKIDPKLADAYDLKWQLSLGVKGRFYSWIWYSLSGLHNMAIQLLNQSLNYYSRVEGLNNKEKSMAHYHLAISYLWEIKSRIQKYKVESAKKSLIAKQVKPSEIEIESFVKWANFEYKQARKIDPQLNDKKFEEDLKAVAEFKFTDEKIDKKIS